MGGTSKGRCVGEGLWEGPARGGVWVRGCERDQEGEVCG